MNRVMLTPNQPGRAPRAGARCIGVVVVAAAVLSFTSPRGDPPTRPAEKSEARFAFPCASYERGLEKGKGNFGVFVSDKQSPFASSWHLAEDVWLPAGTEVRAIAAGVVKYSAFSPSWTDERGQVHWNLGNVIVVEHQLDPPVDGLAAICSFYVHLASDRRVSVGDKVKVGQVIGRIGKGESEENGRYPAHLHFGIHRGPYIQLPPSFEREIRDAAASKDGFRTGQAVLHGEVTLRVVNETSVLVKETAGKSDVLVSLLVGSTAPKDPPPDIMCWCQGYGDEKTVAEWIKPSAFLARFVSASTDPAPPR
jgi:murein DD-endopeptidase MepM/ murein hydrolase activator NlpD